MRSPRSDSDSDDPDVYLAVEWGEHQDVKRRGALWDAERKVWYVPGGVDPEPCRPWFRVYLECPFEEKDDAKELGAKWDKQERRWYVAAKDARDFARWLPQAAAAPPAYAALAPYAPPQQYVPAPMQPAWSVSQQGHAYARQHRYVEHYHQNGDMSRCWETTEVGYGMQQGTSHYFHRSWH